MHSQPTSTQSTIPHEPTHPLECLRVIELPMCVICAEPTKFYCGGCIAGPAFCSSEHFMVVRSNKSIFVTTISELHGTCQYWPTHSRHCERNVTLYASNCDRRNMEVSYPYGSTVTLGTRSAVPPPVALAEIHLPVPVTFGCPYDYTVNAMYAQHDGGTYPRFCASSFQCPLTM